jgi:hypothetical protein
MKWLLVKISELGANCLNSPIALQLRTALADVEQDGAGSEIDSLNRDTDYPSSSQSPHVRAMR